MNGADYLVIGVAVAIAAMVGLILILVSNLLAYFIGFKRKRKHLSTDSKVCLCVYVQLYMLLNKSACKLFLYVHVSKSMVVLLNLRVGQV